MTTLEKTYDPQSIESTWYQQWEEKGYFKATGTGKPYCIMIPPPNVTGSLHMGHGFQYALMDTLIRYHRMCGDKTLWQVGTDHAGIATQMVVERQLAGENSSRHDLGREKFLEKVWEWKHQSGQRISQQMRRMGISVDWSRERFTMDEDLTKAVQKVFIELYQEGLIYRGKRLVNWDPKLHTAISDLEVISEEEQGFMWHIRYPLSDGSGSLEIATTRPETMLGDTAVAVHPEDPRYQSFIGKTVTLPLCQREIPIIADDYVDPEFGTGCVKITPAHDFNDYQVGLRHQLPMLNIFTIDAEINNAAPAAYQGLDRFVARKQIVADLEAAGLLVKVQEHTLKVPRCERTNEIVEPYLTNQWFIRAEALAKPALEAVKSGEINILPEQWQKIYYQWLENIEDWCISRQLWWGHRIPAWFDEEGTIYVGSSEAAIREQHQLRDTIKLRQDEDVLDTWFSSALWPFSTLGWPEQTLELNEFYPTSVLLTGFDIIFFWVARMVMMGLKFTGKIPFHEVYLTGLIRDSEGQKMSKTKGNVLDPLDLIDGISLEELVKKRVASLIQKNLSEKVTKQTKQQFPDGIMNYGTDALRFTYCALATGGRDIRFEVNRLEGYRNFCNKLWNAARYVLLNCQDQDTGNHGGDKIFNLVDHWITSKLQNLIRDVHRHLQHYRFDLLAQSLYEFTWNEFCDWYLELIKPILNGDASDAEKRGTRFTLVNTLETILRLLHPMIPFITEEIWQQLAPLSTQQGETIMLQKFPEANHAVINEVKENEVDWLKQIIIAIRTIRGEMTISPNKKLLVYLNKGTTLDQERWQRNQTLLTTLAKLEGILWYEDQVLPSPTATALVGEMEILIPMADLIDVTAESERLNKELEKITKELARIVSKLENPNFINKAPQEVVEKENNKRNELQHMAQQLQEKLVQLN